LAKAKTRRLNSSQLSSLLTKCDFTTETVQMNYTKRLFETGARADIYPTFSFGSYSGVY